MLSARFCLINPTYYQVRRKAEFVEIELATTKIKQRCTLRETDYKQDAEKNDNVWHLTEAKTVHCSPYEILKAKKAAYIEPSSVGDESTSYRLDKKGLWSKNNYDEKNMDWQLLYSKEKLDQSAQKITQIPVSDIPFQPDAWIDEGAKSASVLKNVDECKLVAAPEKTASPVNDWAFFRFNCWTGDGDVDGANFYVPMKVEVR